MLVVVGAVVWRMQDQLQGMIRISTTPNCHHKINLLSIMSVVGGNWSTIRCCTGDWPSSSISNTFLCFSWLLWETVNNPICVSCFICTNKLLLYARRGKHFWFDYSVVCIELRRVWTSGRSLNSYSTYSPVDHISVLVQNDLMNGWNMRETGSPLESISFFPGEFIWFSARGQGVGLRLKLGCILAPSLIPIIPLGNTGENEEMLWWIYLVEEFEHFVNQPCNQ